MNLKLRHKPKNPHDGAFQTWEHITDGKDGIVGKVDPLIEPSIQESKHGEPRDNEETDLNDERDNLGCWLKKGTGQWVTHAVKPEERIILMVNGQCLHQVTDCEGERRVGSYDIYKVPHEAAKHVDDWRLSVKLRYAAFTGDADLVTRVAKQCMDAGVALNHKGSDGLTALQWAHTCGHTGVVEALQEAQKAQNKAFQEAQMELDDRNCHKVDAGATKPPSIMSIFGRRRLAAFSDGSCEKYPGSVAACQA